MDILGCDVRKDTESKDKRMQNLCTTYMYQI